MRVYWYITIVSIFDNMEEDSIISTISASVLKDNSSEKFATSHQQAIV